MSATSETVRHGDAPAAGGGVQSKAIEVASRGVRTPRDITNFAIAHSLDVLQDRIGPRAANASLRGVTTALRSIEIGQRVGQHHDVADIVEGPPQQEDDVQTRMDRLTAELESLKELRVARS